MRLDAADGRLDGNFSEGSAKRLALQLLDDEANNDPEPLNYREQHLAVEKEVASLPSKRGLHVTYFAVYDLACIGVLGTLWAFKLANAHYAWMVRT